MRKMRKLPEDFCYVCRIRIGQPWSILFEEVVIKKMHSKATKQLISNNLNCFLFLGISLSLSIFFSTSVTWIFSVLFFRLTRELCWCKQVRFRLGMLCLLIHSCFPVATPFKEALLKQLTYFSTMPHTHKSNFKISTVYLSSVLRF